MWEKINNSSLLFSKTYIENKHNIDRYGNRIFFQRLYFYYVNRGYFKIIINSLISLLITNFMVLFLLFLFNCIDYTALINLNSEDHISNFIEINNLLNINWFFMSTVWLFLILDVIKIISIIDDAYIYKNISKFYNNNLKIRDSELEYLEWTDIIQIYQELVDKDIEPYYINLIITTKDNYFTALLDHQILRPIHLNSLFEWNLIYCIIYSFINSNEKVSANLFKNQKLIENTIKNKLQVIAIITMLLMPIIIVFITFYNLFNYGEQFYNKPDLIISKNFTRLAQLKYRNYNELMHSFEERTEKLNGLTRRYDNAFRNKILEAFLKLVIFIFSSVFISLLILTIINDNILTNLNIIGDKNVLWFIGIVGSLIAIFRTIINTKTKENPVLIMEKIGNLIIIDKNYIENANMRIIRNKYLQNYSFKIVQIIYDIFWTVFIPIQMWSMSYDAHYIVNFIKQISKNNQKVGIICLFSDFLDLEEPTYNSLLNDTEREVFDQKRTFSAEKFTNEYQNNFNENSNHSLQIQVI